MSDISKTKTKDNDVINPIPVSVINFPDEESEPILLTVNTVCIPEKTTTWYHIIYGMSNGVEFLHPKKSMIPSCTQSRMQVPFSSDEIITDFNDSIANRLNELGYFARNITTGTERPIDSSLINLLTIEGTSTVCSDPGMGIIASD